MKKIITLLTMIFCSVLLVCCTSAPVSGDVKPNETKSAFENTSLAIECVDGKIHVKGSFDSVGNNANEYFVNCTIIRDAESKPMEVSKKFALAEGTNSFDLDFSIYSKEQTMRVSVVSADENVIIEQTEKVVRSFRLLSVGNSFSVDAQQHLYGIAADMGYDNIVLGNLYIGGCSLYGHNSTAQNNRASYIYYKNTTGEWTEKPETTMLYGLTDENWDYITFQQASGVSGQADTYNSDLTNLVNYVKSNIKNPKAEFVWHMTWAYSSDSTHQDFVKYDNDQMKMYEGITSAVQEKIVTNEDIAFVIPAGTAIQNARNTTLGDTLCRDGFHLELGYGRYLAGLTWIHKITGESIDEVTYIPDNMFDEATLEILKDCAKKAVANPFEVTE